MEAEQINEILINVASPRKKAGINVDLAELRKCFSSAENSIRLNIQLLAAVPSFLLEIHEMVDENVRSREGLVVQRKIFEAYCFWIDPPTNTKKKPVKAEQKSEQKNRNVDDVSKAFSALSLENQVADWTSLLREVLQLKVDLGYNIWFKVVGILYSKFGAVVRKFLEAVDEALLNGTATYPLLCVCIKDPRLRRHFQSNVLFQVLLMGELPAEDIEYFAQDGNRPNSSVFREQCRTVLRDVLKSARKSEQENWSTLLRAKINQEETDVPAFKKFAKHVASLLPDLGDELPTDTDFECSIGKEFGQLVIKDAIKGFSNKTLDREAYRERIWAVLAQRPELKTEVIQDIENVVTSHERDSETGYWNGIDAFPYAMISNLQSKSDIIDGAADEDNEFHALPTHMKDKILFVNDPEKLARLVQDLKFAKEKAKHTTEPVAIVGIDVEWSPYRRYGEHNKATILQIATRETGIYIIDLEPEDETWKQAVIQFLSTFFNDESIMKIGFQFESDDLKNLRYALPSCKSLYSPAMLVCIEELLREIFMPEGKKKEKKSLSDYCKERLESKKPLNKAEQISVWDRRPLRPSQLRYAALDAYCLVELFDCCVIQAKNLRRDAYSIAMSNSNMQRITTPFPLFVVDL